ncbi:hypothetical protein QQP08_005173 [Theobroma cacao]|nr:hypothetical protein QQP08_005173 [Theobroma cacao]
MIAGKFINSFDIYGIHPFALRMVPNLLLTVWLVSIKAQLLEPAMRGLDRFLLALKSLHFLGNSGSRYNLKLLQVTVAFQFSQ